jgi:hypothetical protein
MVAPAPKPHPSQVGKKTAPHPCEVRYRGRGTRLHRSKGVPTFVPGQICRSNAGQSDESAFSTRLSATA